MTGVIDVVAAIHDYCFGGYRLFAGHVVMWDCRMRGGGVVVVS